MAKHRANGEGTIYQRKDGRWCASISIGYFNGKLKRKNLYARTRKEVVDKMKVALRDQQQGINIAPARLTVKQFLELWLEQVVKVRNRPRTYETYQHTVNRYITPRLGHYQLTRLNPGHVQIMLNDMRKEGLTRTIPYTRSILVIALNVAVRWDYVSRNVAVAVDAPVVERRTIQPLTKAQAQALLDAVKGNRLEALYQVTLMLGLRRGEVLGLRWEDIDLEAATMRITGAVLRQQKRLERTATKTKGSVRLLPLPKVLVDALKAHRARQDVERQEEGWQEHGLVFPSQTGGLYEPRNLNHHFDRALKRAGLPKTTRFHDLRHSAATLMLLQNVPLRVISQILGHTQMRTTADTYAHVLPELERQAADQIDALFGTLDGQVNEPSIPEGEAESGPMMDSEDTSEEAKNGD
jgi:integrase